MVADLHDRAPAPMAGWCRIKIERITKVVRAENDSAGDKDRKRQEKVAENKKRR